MEKSDFTEALDSYIKKYIKENISVRLFTETDYEGRPYAIEVYVSLDGEDFSYDRAIF